MKWAVIAADILTNNLGPALAVNGTFTGECYTVPMQVVLVQQALRNLTWDVL